MKLDSNEQRALLRNLVLNAHVTGSVQDLVPLMSEVSQLIITIENAELEERKEEKNEGETSIQNA